jgi:hypothetical protein
VLGEGEGEADSTTVTAGSGVLRGDCDWGLRFLRTVTLRMSSVFHSRFGMASLAGEPLSFPAASGVVVPTVSTRPGAGAFLVGVTGKEGACRPVGVTSSRSCSNASPNPRSSSTVLRRSLAGVADRLSSRSEEMGSSLAVWYEVAREEG